MTSLDFDMTEVLSAARESVSGADWQVRFTFGEPHLVGEFPNGEVLKARITKDSDVAKVAESMAGEWVRSHQGEA